MQQMFQTLALDRVPFLSNTAVWPGEGWSGCHQESIDRQRLVTPRHFFTEKWWDGRDGAAGREVEMVIVAELQKLFWLATAAFECSTFAVSKAWPCCEQPVITVMLWLSSPALLMCVKLYTETCKIWEDHQLVVCQVQIVHVAALWTTPGPEANEQNEQLKLRKCPLPWAIVDNLVQDIPRKNSCN